ncbi:MAG TPA: hypothetical protein VGO80_17995, partial [Solirubrobacteraceae bacterium]|nr:hypothetical protein [Solirubrobacteraceae bacterium]
MDPTASVPASACVDNIESRGYDASATWASPEEAAQTAALIAADLGADLPDVVRNPHLKFAWAEHAVRSSPLASRIVTILGSDTAIENTL